VIGNSELLYIIRTNLILMGSELRIAFVLFLIFCWNSSYIW
jgi:hypothetical protein